MKFKNIIGINSIAIMLLLVAMASCKKESRNIFNMFTGLKVTLDSTTLPNSVGFYTSIKDSGKVVFNFTVESADVDIYQVSIYQVGSALPFLNIPVTDPAQRRKFSYTYDMGVWTGSVGLNTYRIFAYDSAGIYIGDGYKPILIDVESNYTFYPNRKLYFPDSATGNTNCYLSLKKGATFNYQTAAANSADIDLGLYNRPVLTNGTWVDNLFIYSPSLSPLTFNIFDISNWTKRTTRFANVNTGQAANFARNYNSGNRIATYARGRNPNLLQTTTGLVSGSVGGAISFLTPEGNYGIILLNSITQDSDGRKYIDVSIKYKN
jgi:hypothetical protein